MDDKAMEKYGALGGIWFLVLAVIGSLLPGTPPNRTDSAEEIAAWFGDNASSIQLGAFLSGIGVIGLIWWLGSVWRAMSRAEGGSPRLAVIALSGFVFSGAMAFSAFAVNAAVAADAESLGGGGGAAFFFGLSSVLYAYSSIGSAVMLLAISGLALRTGFLPKWLAQAGVVLVAAEIVSSYGVASDASFLGLLGFITFLAWVLWVAGLGWILYQRQENATNV